jgi:septal ring factor EnvC (AmiA/AmiB activator)
LFFFSKARSRLNQQQTDQLRSDINSSLNDLEQSQKLSNQLTRVSRSVSPIHHSYRSSSADEQRNHRLISKVSFENNPLIER